MSAFSIGLSALRVNQRLIDLTGQNIANAGTPDYHRQSALLAARTVGLPIGTGVEISKLTQARSEFIESALLRTETDLQDATSRLQFLRSIETIVAPTEGSVHDLLERLFNQIDQLAADPGDIGQRRVVLGTASDLANKLGSIEVEFRRLSSDVENEARLLVDEINGLTPQIAALNDAIQQAVIRGDSANDLRDQRTALNNRLAGLIDVRTIDQDFGQVAVIAAGFPVVLGSESTPLEMSLDAENKLRLSAVATPLPLTVNGGKLAALLETRNDLLPAFRDHLDRLATELVGQLDALQATGLGLDGPLTFLSGQRSVSDATVPLDQAGLRFSVKAGELAVSVTDLTTGQRVLTRIAIDPATQSLQDLATALSGVANLQAIADPQTNTLQLLAAPGFGFDFAGRLPTDPATSAITGTAVPSIAGTYSGTDNDTYTFEVVGSGTIGVTAGLTLEIRDAGGTLLGTRNIGLGYEPGSTLEPIDGLTVRLSAGTANNGDLFTIPVTSEPDTAGILTALGINTLFTGEDTEGFTVRAELLAHPELVATGRSGLPGDGAYLARIDRLRDEKLFAGGKQDFREFYAALVGEVAERVRDMDLRQTARKNLHEKILAERQSVSGVDPNEELVRLLEFQRAFQTSARYLATVNETLAELINII